MKKINILIVLILASFTMFSQWEIRNFTNEFNEKTEHTYKYLLCDGTFSNSATLKSNLSVVFFDLNKEVSIKLYEYNKYLATFKKCSYVYVKVKNPKGVIETFKFKENNKQLFIKNKNKLIFLDFIKDVGVYKFYIKDNNYGVSTYNFNVEIL